jgi:hypothetical protein
VASHTNGIPALSVQSKIVEARYYNRVRLALIRLKRPLRFELTGVGKADILLTEEIWLCVDRSRDDLPLMAWTDFETKGRNALHEPVRCKLRYFHVHAGMLSAKVLPVLDGILEERLQLSES